MCADQYINESKDQMTSYQRSPRTSLMHVISVLAKGGFIYDCSSMASPLRAPQAVESRLKKRGFRRIGGHNILSTDETTSFGIQSRAT